MFLVENQRSGIKNALFFHIDPRIDGFKGDITEGVDLEDDITYVSSWPQGERRPEACLGQNVANPIHYKVFKFREELQTAGFQPIMGLFGVFNSWSDYTRLVPGIIQE